jgi:PAS domain S-box-containing protein
VPDERTQRALLAHAAEVAPVAIFVADGDLNCLAANDAASDLVGFTREELAQKRVSTLAIGRDPSGPEADAQTLLDAGITLLRRKDGGAVVVRYYAKRIVAAGSPLQVVIMIPRRILSADLTPQEIGGQARRTSDATSLSERELEILTLLADGHDNLAIARELYLSIDTVKSSVRRVLQKLGAGSRTHAVALAFRRGLLD